MPIAAGDRAPDFTLPAHDGQQVALASLLARGPVVVFFYPKDETAHCIKEACAFRDQYHDFTGAGATVLGISSDSADSHERFAAKHRLPYPLLVDAGGQVREQFGVPRALLGLMPGRVTYVIDRGGIVRHVFSSMFSPEKHIEEAIGVIRGLA